ncbi:hypothetical protein J3Q64DRAFT_1194360 [Phycomyces blakesleeanus]|uniref:Uncharacterized protein n=1 Tax=Phycomyces blakesleeanus TaxID=4837 RepID=A0ABR3ATB0_PHYBL
MSGGWGEIERELTRSLITCNLSPFLSLSLSILLPCGFWLGFLVSWFLYCTVLYCTTFYYVLCMYYVCTCTFICKIYNCLTEPLKL